jgi:hypothetical protein
MKKLSRRDFYYFDGIHKVRIYGIREFILAEEHKNNSYMIKRTKNWIQVKIHFLGMSYEWINISRYELMMFKESEKKLDSLLGKC